MVTSVDDWARAACDSGSYVDVFRYEYANPQMGAQQSVFTFTGRLRENHDAVLAQRLPEAGLTMKVVIPRAYRNLLRKRLFWMNVNALALFPDIEGVGRNISEAIQCDFSLGDEGLQWVLDERVVPAGERTNGSERPSGSHHKGVGVTRKLK